MNTPHKDEVSDDAMGIYVKTQLVLWMSTDLSYYIFACRHSKYFIELTDFVQWSFGVLWDSVPPVGPCIPQQVSGGLTP